MTLNELRKQIARLNKQTDGITDEITEALEAYQRQYELELRRVEFDLDNGLAKSTAANYVKAENINMVQKLKFKGIVKAAAKQYNTVAFLTKNFHKELGIEADQFNYRDLRVLKAFKNQDSFTLFNEGLQLDNLVKKELINMVALNQPYDNAIENLSKNLLGAGEKQGRLARYSKTYLNTSIQGLSRSVDKEIMDQLDLSDQFLYAGTIDKKIRPFCKAHIGKIYTRKQIEKFPVENGSGLDPWFAPGGYNCRHRMIAKDLI